MNIRTEVYKSIAAEAQTLDSIPVNDTALPRSGGEVESEEKRRKEVEKTARETWLEECMKNVRQFIRNIDINQL